MRVLGTCRWMSLVALGLSACGSGDDGGNAVEETDEADVEETTLTVHVFGAPQMSQPVDRQAAEFEDETGIKVNVVKQDDFGKLFSDVRGSTEYDLALSASIWVPDFVDNGDVIPLDDYLGEHIKDSELAWDDIPGGVRRKNEFAGHTYSLLADNDNMFLHYRKDILGDEQWQSEFEEEKGYAMPVPPATLDELYDVASWFETKDWNPDEDDVRSMSISTDGAGQTHYYALAWIAPYVAAPKSGLLYFDEDMNPLVNTPGFLEGLSKWKQMIDCCVRPDDGNDHVNRVDVIEQFIQGRALFAIDWGDIGPAALRDNSVVAGKVGWALPPGSDRYFHDGDWVDTDSVHYAPVHQFNGWAWFLMRNSERPDEAFQFIQYVLSPTVSAATVSHPDGGYQPWRTSHAGKLDAWLDNGWVREDAETYVQTVLDTTNHPNAIFDTRIPRISDYEGAFEAVLREIVDGDVTVEDAMKALAKSFDEITDEKGRSVQKRAYADHLGIE